VTNKYSAVPTVVDNVRFASKAEATRYRELLLLERAGFIRGLELQPAFPLYVAPHRGADVHHVCTYIADFRYREGPRGVLRVEDVKGVRTPVYRLKKKMVEAQYGIAITEIGPPSRHPRRRR